MKTIIVIPVFQAMNSLEKISLIKEKLMQAGMKNIIVLSDVDRKMLRERFMKIEM